MTQIVDCETAVVLLWFQKRTDSLHETLNRAEDLWVLDELRIHVGVVVDHLPEKESKYEYSMTLLITAELQYLESRNKVINSV